MHASMGLDASLFNSLYAGAQFEVTRALHVKRKSQLSELSMPIYDYGHGSGCWSAWSTWPSRCCVVICIGQYL